MNPNKSDAKLSLKRKGECAPFVPRKIPIASSHVTKIKNDGIHKPKIVDSTGVSASSKYRKLHNCLPAELTPISNKTKILNSKRKSISLVELPSIQKICTLKKRYSKEQGDETKMSIIASKRCNITSLNSVEEFELARKVCKIFILHSWRKRRYEVTKLRIDAQKIENEVSLKSTLVPHKRHKIWGRFDYSTDRWANDPSGRSVNRSNCTTDRWADNPLI
ncbi:uncharacterized protein LOC124353695 [Homalodisca vitripennis]|uniref:uncharacterized protein LOC124353695 n=1 Tax=Homalodisca vitripennis TaxID=197043 RepID=UPI001EE9B1AC|nr:uncharacterized protein LOC124353695 [Homalodisca vitripennis]